MGVYRFLLYLLPRSRREQHGEQMAMAFGELARRQRGAAAVAGLWAKEMSGLVRFAVRERLQRAGSALKHLMPESGSNFGHEIRWAWSGVRARGWRGGLVIGLLGGVLAANTVVFSAADSFVLRRTTYADADRLAELGRMQAFGWRNYVPLESVAVWRGFTDLFSAVYTYDSDASAYLSKGEGPRFVPGTSVEPGLLEMLGAQPIAGRLFGPSDAHAGPPTVALISQDTAIAEFGSAQAALGQSIKLDDIATTIIGVLPSAFRFPSGAERFWTPYDLSSQRPNSSGSMLVKLAPGMTLERLALAVRSREAAVEAQRTQFKAFKEKQPLEVRAITPAQVDPRLRRIFVLLIVAAGCLLLVACANVINVELTTAVGRARTYAIGLALGASRGALLRTALYEGFMALALSSALASAIAWQLITTLSKKLPPEMVSPLTNRLDVDGRAVAFMLVIAGFTWLVTSLPVAVMSARTNVLDVLNQENRSSSGTKTGARVRRALTIAEVAITVVLLVGALLSAKSYSGLLAIPTGFDAEGVAAIDVRRAPGDSESQNDLSARLTAAMRAVPYVAHASEIGTSPPDYGQAITGNLTISGRAEPQGRGTLGGYEVGPDYFAAMRVPLRSGRTFTATDPDTFVVVDEEFAKRFWPNADALGAKFNIGKASFGQSSGQYEIIGIAAHMRTQRDSVSAASSEFFPIYLRLGDYHPLNFAVRLTDERRLTDLTNLLKALTPGSRVRAEFVRDRYAALFANEMLAAAVMTAFSIFAFVVAMAGIYGVMAFLVAGRTREIGIRMALGADTSAINRMVVGSSVKLVLAGAALGGIAAFAGAGWASNLLFGVTASDPSTYAIVIAAVAGTAILATWHPARTAARVDPSCLLRT